ncbi:MAG TPA: flagellar basal body L-ring protein FlgH, partial [Comamonas denitrificans]|nr:flagellar basal body L-ring protein FlgH [Comamonas denitrificans]
MAGFTPLSFRPAHVGLLAAAVLSGCALNNPPPVDIGNTAPVSAGQIAPPTQVVSNSGSLYQASRYRPVFENRRARMVGDTVMVQIVEKVAASQKQSSNV